ncbi:MAG: extracellular solute-binding protein [Nocardioides sp.]
MTLRFGVSGDEVLRAAYEKLGRVYTNAHPEVTVELVGLQGGRALVDEVRAEPLDVFVATNEEAPQLVVDELVQPVDQLLEERGVTFGDDYQRHGVEGFSAEQALQCMPYDVSPLVVFYNPGLVPFRRLVEPGDTPPSPTTGWTWAQFGRAARLMSRQGVRGAYIEPRLDTLIALTRSAGADIVDDPQEATTLTFADESTRAALEVILAVVRDPEITPTIEQLEKIDGVRRFAQEKVGMMFGTRALVPELRQRAGFDFDVFPLPRLARTRSVSDVTGFCLSSTTEHAEAAVDFLAFATKDRGAEILAESGAVVPAHLPTLNSLAFTQPGEAPSSALVFDEMVERSYLVPFNPNWPELRQAVEPEVMTMFDDPVIDLDLLLPRIDAKSRAILTPEQATSG